MGITQNIFTALLRAVAGAPNPTHPQAAAAEEEPPRTPTLFKVKQPATVEAMQYNGTGHTAVVIGAWSYSYGNQAGYSCHQETCTGEEADHILTVDTLDGARIMNPGDWLTRNHMGTFTHYTDQQFKETYERA